MMSKGGAMTSQFEFEEVMRAAMKFGSDKSVDEVVAEQEARHVQQRMEAKLKRPTPAGQPSQQASTRPRVGQPIPQGRMNELNALLAKVPKPE